VDGTYSGTINWGDGNTSANTYSNSTHTYNSPGDYTVTITGTINDWSFYDGVTSRGTPLGIISVTQWGTLLLDKTGGFYNCENLTLTSVVDVPNINNNGGFLLFNNCLSITTINRIGEWDVSNVISMTGMFFNCTSFNDNMFRWDVSNVTDMGNMFVNTLFNNDVSRWNVSNVVNMGFMFFGNSVFNQDISGWDVSNVNNMSGMFADSISFNQNIGGWNVSNVTNMTFFLSNAASFTSTNLDNIYNGWSTLPSLQLTVTFDAESICYNSSAQAGRDILTNTYGWIITDNGICPTPTPTPTSTPTPTVTQTNTPTTTQTNTPTTTVTPTKTTTPTPTSTQLYFLLFEDDSIATAENNDNIEIDII